MKPASDAALPAERFYYAGTELDALSAAPNYYRAIARAFAPHVGARAVEIGAGIGTFSAHLLRETDVRELAAVEPAANNFPHLAARLRGEPRARALQGLLEDHVESLRGADSLVAVNVLEHVEDDGAFLRNARATLRPGGALLLFVPALQELYGSLDAAFGHHRRYRKATLGGALTSAGFRDLELRYFNSLGMLSWLLVGRVLRQTTLTLGAVRAYDSLVIPWLMRLEAQVEPALGQSLLAIARAP